MMVICINNGEVKNGNGKYYSAKELTEGAQYAVAGYTDGGYILLGIKSIALDGSYSKCRFIPLSTIDEMELLEQRQTELA